MGARVYVRHELDAGEFARYSPPAVANTGTPRHDTAESWLFQKGTSMKVRYALPLFAAAVFSCDVAAQTMKPGLWEMTHDMKSGSGEMDKARAQTQREMAKMPPEQRKMMEEMMAKHGAKMGAGGPGSGMSIKTCMTKEMVERNEVPAHQGDCKTTKQQRTGNTLKVAYTCTNPPSSGEGEYTFASSEAFRMKMTMHTTVQGKRETMNMEGSGKWLSADCGNVKPIQPPAKK